VQPVAEGGASPFGGSGGVVPLLAEHVELERLAVAGEVNGQNQLLAVGRVHDYRDYVSVGVPICCDNAGFRCPSPTRTSPAVVNKALGLPSDPGLTSGSDR
jgi:hypothetical protein